MILHLFFIFYRFVHVLYFSVCLIQLSGCFASIKLCCVMLNIKCSRKSLFHYGSKLELVIFNKCIY